MMLELQQKLLWSLKLLTEQFRKQTRLKKHICPPKDNASKS